MTPHARVLNNLVIVFFLKHFQFLAWLIWIIRVGDCILFPLTNCLENPLYAWFIWKSLVILFILLDKHEQFVNKIVLHIFDSLQISAVLFIRASPKRMLPLAICYVRILFNEPLWHRCLKSKRLQMLAIYASNKCPLIRLILFNIVNEMFNSIDNLLFKCLNFQLVIQVFVILKGINCSRHLLINHFWKFLLFIFYIWQVLDLKYT